ncbi:aminotransferase class V-fold PLP-dependent enzyme [Pediococcus acidilactici]|uniref:aminotransferase class V-fold PLP-dependent enzyme n=1 Tax=Pediococcus acidilactici TaxID=1254 RepID=UPI003CEFD84B
MFGPTGIGVLYGKLARLEEMEPVRFGGEMVDLVTPTSATFQPLTNPFRSGDP